MRVGFGSFNEKLLQPFVMQPFDLNVPPLAEGGDAPYAFRHSINFTTDFEDFKVCYTYMYVVGRARGYGQGLGRAMVWEGYGLGGIYNRSMDGSWIRMGLGYG